jgi:hypothetical protein
MAFASFAWGAARRGLGDIRLLYDSVDNVVLSGTAAVRGGLLLPRGGRTTGVPGGREAFSDVLLAVGDGAGGWRRYAITERALQELEIDLPGGTCRYRGPAFLFSGRASASFSDMRARASGLSPCDIELELSFEARPYDAVNVAFPHVPKLVRRLGANLARQLRELLPGDTRSA